MFMIYYENIHIEINNKLRINLIDIFLSKFYLYEHVELHISNDLWDPISFEISRLNFELTNEIENVHI
jgi:hypothetical protein